MLYYKINPINLNKVVSDIQKIIVNYNGNKETSIMVIKIVETSRDDHEMIPKLEHKKM